MLRKLTLTLFLATVTAGAKFTVRIGPPPVVVERPIASPGPGYVWTPGFYRWDGHAYVWVPGGWVMAPWPGARWITPHWVRRHGGWVFVEGHWR